MPTVHDLRNSKFLTKEDCSPDILVTIERYEQLDVSQDTEPEDNRWCLFFKELEKPLVLNVTNGSLIAAITGSEDFDDWIGRQVVLYNDPNITFAGKVTGGIRVRASKKQQPKPIQEDDIPF